MKPIAEHTNAQLKKLATEIENELDTTYDGLMSDPPPWLVKLKDVLNRRHKVRAELKNRNAL